MKNKTETYKILAIDPGDTFSAYCFLEKENGEINILEKDKVHNTQLRQDILINSLDMLDVNLIVIEQISSYGMPVGKHVFDTVFWSGRFHELAQRRYIETVFIPRREVKLFFCNSVRAKDSNVIQALVNKYAASSKNHGKGTKKEPDYFYGFKKDIWQAFALGAFFLETKNN